ncbi:MAG: ABC transporter substrate-binding protein [Deltaproteobacteria bacterium]|nr:ABC transporter substrate-binding protein [Deltaproteobacteria bacterium]
MKSTNSAKGSRKISIHDKGINRREFLKKTSQFGLAATLVGTGAFFKTSPVWGEKSLKGSGEVIFCGWGGTFQDAQREIFFKPFTKETGIKVIDTTMPSTSKVKAQVDSGNVEWDTAHLGIISTMLLGEKYLEKIDYGYFNDADYKAIHEDLRRPLICGSYFFPNVIAFNTKKFPKGNQPNSWADFIDFNRFPGKRMFYTGMGGGWFQLEAALLGMGVPREKFFPPDMKKAWAFYNKLKPNCIKWWIEGAVPIQGLQNGEVDVTMAYSARVQKLIDEGQPFGFTWNGGIVGDIGWSVLKGAKNATNAMKLIAFCGRPELQAKLADQFPYGPANVEAIRYVKPETKPKLPTTPENMKNLVFVNWDWQFAKTLDPSGQKSNREYLAEEFQAWLL